MEVIHEITRKILINLMELKLLDGIGNYMSDAKEIRLIGIQDLTSARIEKADCSKFSQQVF